MTKALKVNIVYVGWPRSASTWFYNWAKLSDSLNVARVKDAGFFFPDRVRAPQASDFKRGECSTAKTVEVCHDYIFDTAALSRIAGQDVSSKVIVFLRSPRSWVDSELRYLMAIGKLPSKIERLPKEIEDYFRHYLAYEERLAVLRRYFDSRNIGIFFTEDLSANPLGFSKSLSLFLGIPDLGDLGISPPGVANSRPQPRGLLTPSILGGLRVGAKAVLPLELYLRLKGSKLRNLLFETSAELPQVDHSRDDLYSRLPEDIREPAERQFAEIQRACHITS